MKVRILDYLCAFVIIALLMLFFTFPAITDQAMPAYLEKYLDEKFQTVNNNLEKTNQNLDNLLERFIEYKEKQNQRIADQDKCIAAMQAEIANMRYTVYGVLSFLGLSGGGVYIRSRFKKGGNGRGNGESINV